MNSNLWPATVPFDPETESIPAALEALWSRLDEQRPALVLAVGAGAQEGGWAQRAAVALATSWADRGGRLVLADLALSAPSLHTELGEANTDGIADIFQFGASVRSMVRVVPGRGFRYLPAGAYIPEPVAILRSPGWDHILGQFREDSATLLAYLPLDSEGGEELARRLGRAIVLASPEEAAALATRVSEICSVEAVLSPPDPTAIVADQVAEEPEEAGEDPVQPEESAAEELSLDEVSLTEPPLIPRRHRRSRGGMAVVLRVLLPVTVLLGGLVLLDAQGLLPEWAALPEWLSFTRDDTAGASAATTGVVAANGAAGGVAEGEGSTGPGGAPAVPEPVTSPIPYSIAVEAHQDFDTAVERVEILRRSEPGTTFYLTPIPNQGVVYYRLLAGPVADTTAAWELMRHLVDARHKTDLDPWSIRPTVWAFHLGDYPTEAMAAARAEELLQHRIPTYVVEVDYTSGPPRYRLFAGAYEGPAPAEVMAELLREAGIEARLVRREGKAPR